MFLVIDLNMFKIFQGVATILTLHRVHPLEAGKLAPNENMKVSPEFLEKFILDAKARGYSFIRLDDLNLELLKSKTSKKLVITLDDGYSDNFDYAYPIFQKHNVPFAVYVTTSFPDRSAILWWYALEDLIIQNDVIDLSDSSVFYCRSNSEKNDSFLKIREKIISLPSTDLLGSLQVLFSKYNINWHFKVNQLGLSWEQIEVMSKGGLATIGGHTINHLAMNSLSLDELTSEILGGKKIIEGHIKKHVEHFCYPFGGVREVGKREFEMVKKLGFKTATTTRYGHVFPAHADHLEALPRVMLTEDFKWGKLYWGALKRFVRGRRFTVL